MSTPIGGSGRVNPLQPTTQQPPAQQQVERQTPAPQQQAPAKTGQIINNINQFSSQPVSTDLQQLQQWLMKLKNPDAAAQPSSLQQAQANGRRNEQVIQQSPQEQEIQIREQTRFTINGPNAPAKPPELDSSQKRKLQTGTRKLAEKADIREVDVARLVHAKATENSANYNFQLGRLNIPPSSSQGRMLETGLNKLISSVDGPKEAIAAQASKILVIEDVARLADAADISPSLAVDLGALTHNEEERFQKLAQATGIPSDKASTLLNGFEKLGEKYNLDTEGLDEALGDASRAVDTALGEKFKQAATKLNLEQDVFNGMANSVLTSDTRQFIEIGQEAGLSRTQIQAALPKVTREIAAIQTEATFPREKLLRYSQDTLVQQQLAEAGNEFGLNSLQTLALVAAFVEGGLESYVEQAREYDLGRQSSTLLNRIEAVEAQHGRGALSLSTNNLAD